MQKVFFLLLIILISFSCIKDKIIHEKFVIENSSNLNLKNIKENIQDIIPTLPQSSKENISPFVYNYFLKDSKNIQVKAINKDERFLIKHYEKEAFQLYFKKNTPEKAGSYQNSSSYLIYDFFYNNNIASQNAYNNIIFEISNNTSKYFDYFKGLDCYFFLDNKRHAITIIIYSGVSGLNEGEYLKKFVESNGKHYDNISTANPLGIKIIK